MLVLLTIVLALLLAGCSRGQSEIKPPTIRLGEDKCADCDMIINDMRFACAAIHEVSAGDYESLLFDDIGDLVRYLAKHSDQTFAASYVHDYETKAWIEADKAAYVSSPELKTPMASGLLAVSSIDNFLKPILMARGAGISILLIALGVIGGVLVFGFIGIFLGPVLLALGHMLFGRWIDEEQGEEQSI